MLNLLRKDFIILKSSLWLCIFYLAVFSAAFIPGHPSSLQIVGIYTAFATLSLGTMIDIKNRNHNFLVSLPISRKHIVQAKYIAAIIYALFGIFASYGIHLLVKLAAPQFNKPDYSLIDLAIPAGIMLVLISIYMPLFYALSKKGTAIINIVFMIILIVLAQPTAFIMNTLNENGFINVQTLLLILSISVLLLFIASYNLTVYLFARKDL